MPHPLAVTDFFGKERVEEGLFSKTEMQQNIAVRLSVFNELMFIGRFPSGQPDIVKEFASVEDFRKYHDADDTNDISVQLLKRLVNPMRQDGIGGAGTIRTMQVGNQTRATRPWNNTGPSLRVTLTTTAYGLAANKFESKFETGTTANTVKLSVRKRGDPSTVIVRDNLGLAFTIQYTGSAAAGTLTITVVSDSATTVTLLQDAVAIFTFSTADPQFNTVGKLVAAIDALADYTCTLATGVDSLMPTTYLDAAAAVDIKAAPVTRQAQLGSVVWYVNENLKDYYTAVRASAAVAFGTMDTAYVFASGATDPSVTTQDWTDALGFVDDADLAGGFLFPITTDSAVQAVCTTFIVSQYSDHSKTWRSCYATAPGATAQQAKDLAFAHAHTRVGVVLQRIQDIDSAGVLQDYDPIHLAAIVIGGSCGTAITNPLTRKRLNVRGLKDQFGKTTRVDLLKAGVIVAKKKQPGAVVFSMLVTSAQDNKRMPRVWSDSMAVDFLHNNVNEPLKDLAGTWADDGLKPAAEMLITRVLDLAQEAKVISKGEDDSGASLPPYVPPRATVGQGLLSAEWKAFIGGEIDHIGIRGGVEYQSFGLSVPISV